MHRTPIKPDETKLKMLTFNKISTLGCTKKTWKGEQPMQTLATTCSFSFFGVSLDNLWEWSCPSREEGSALVRLGVETLAKAIPRGGRGADEAFCSIGTPWMTARSWDDVPNLILHPRLFGNRGVTRSWGDIYFYQQIESVKLWRNRECWSREGSIQKYK